MVTHQNKEALSREERLLGARPAAAAEASPLMLAWQRTGSAAFWSVLGLLGSGWGALGPSPHRGRHCPDARALWLPRPPWGGHLG